MRIAILTYWWSKDNYGQLLQCYALQKHLQNHGHEVFFIRYNYNDEGFKITSPLWNRILRAFNPIIFYKHFEKKILIKKETLENNERKFDEFRKKYLSFSQEVYKNYESLKLLPPDADAYIVGSDQVWNFSFTNFEQVKPVVHAYMLDFGLKNIKRLSYAASWGVYSISENLKDEIIPLLKNFNYISVREKSGKILCEQCGRNDVEWVCDPTLTLKPEIYRDLYKENIINKKIHKNKKYILLYMLSNKTNYNLKLIYEFAKKRNLDVVLITGNFSTIKKEKYYATIPEWLYLIDNAEYIISNSFHCAIFSIIFNKQFAVIKLVGIHEGMNTRMDSLFELLGIEERYLKNNDFSVLDKIYKIKKINFNNQFLNML